MSKLKEFILKEVSRDEELKHLWEISIKKQFGAMTRYLDQKLAREPDDWLREFLLRDIGKAESDMDRLGFIEAHIKVNLLERIKKNFPEPVSNEEFEISYLEAKEECLALREERKMEEASARKEPPKSEKPKRRNAEYELLFTGKKRKFISSLQAEGIRNKIGIGRGIFIDDERKEVFFQRKLLKEFKNQLYALLVHFVIHEGIGGSKEFLYDNIWGAGVAADDYRDDAVYQAIRRFRAVLKKYNIGKVPAISNSIYSASKSYVLKPRLKYCVLRRVEKENEE